MHIFKDQMYVEKLVPQGGAKQREPIIFVHGQAQTGTVSLNPYFPSWVRAHALPYSMNAE